MFLVRIAAFKLGVGDRVTGMASTALHACSSDPPSSAPAFSASASAWCDFISVTFAHVLRVVRHREPRYGLTGLVAVVMTPRPPTRKRRGRCREVVTVPCPSQACWSRGREAQIKPTLYLPDCREDRCGRPVRVKVNDFCTNLRLAQAW